MSLAGKNRCSRYYRLIRLVIVGNWRIAEQVANQKDESERNANDEAELDCISKQAPIQRNIKAHRFLQHAVYAACTAGVRCSGAAVRGCPYSRQWYSTYRLRLGTITLLAAMHFAHTGVRLASG